jgi:hypothetical protein
VEDAKEQDQAPGHRREVVLQLRKVTDQTRANKVLRN